MAVSEILEDRRTDNRWTTCQPTRAITKDLLGKLVVQNQKKLICNELMKIQSKYKSAEVIEKWQSEFSLNK